MAEEKKDKKDNKFKDMEPKKDAKGGNLNPHQPVHQYGVNPPIKNQGLGGPPQRGK